MYLNFIFKTCYTFTVIQIISDVGFCFGVKNAVEKLKEIKNDSGRIFLLHPLIHNALLNDKLLKENLCKATKRNLGRFCYAAASLYSTGDIPSSLSLMRFVLYHSI